MSRWVRAGPILKTRGILKSSVASKADYQMRKGFKDFSILSFKPKNGSSFFNAEAQRRKVRRE